MATNGIRQETVNTFKDGMIMDFNPLIASNTAYTHALNATYITMNGNEHIIQNDMGNGRVETAYLPEGYIPLGTTEFGGIIYIVSYNPLTDRCQIGSFPSPERNVTSDELGESAKTLNTSVFYDSVDSSALYKSIITACTYKLILTDSALNPGDKFVVYETTGNLSGCDYISAKTQDLDLSDADLYPKYLKLSIVAIQDNGTVTSLNDALTWYEYDSNNYGYYIYPNASDVESDGTLVLDEYRNLVSSNYSVFTCKVSGKLAILAKLEAIDTFSVSWDAIKQSVSDDSGDSENKWVFYFYTNWSYENDNFNSKDKINLYGIKVEEYSCDDEGKANETATGDAEYIIIDNYPKKANGVTYINEDQNNSSSSNYTNDALTNLRTKFYAPDYISSLDVLTDDNGNAIEDIYCGNSNNTTRANDGNDNQFLIQTGYVLQQEAENGKYGYVQLVVSPMMPFGTLDYLKQSFTINVDKLGSGDIDLKGYKYWWEEENITLNWSLECYPERNKSVKSVTFNFYEYNEDVKEWIEDENNTQYIDDYALWYDGESYTLIENANDEAEEITGDSCTMTPYSGNPDATFVKDNLSSYSGNFSESLSQSTLGFNNGSLYLVEIIVNYNDEKYVYYYRFMYTSNIFNDQYYKVDDYKDLVLNDYLTDDNAISVTATNIEQNLNSTAEYVDVSPDNVDVVSGTNYTIEDNDDNLTAQIENSTKYTYTTADEADYYKEESTADVKFIYQNRYLDSNVNFDIEATNNIFTVTLNAIGKAVTKSGDSYSVTEFDSDDIETEVDVSDAEGTTLSKSSSSKTDNEGSVDYQYELKEINLDTDNMTGNINFNLLLNNNIYIDYTYQEDLDIEFQLSHLTIGYYLVRSLARTDDDKANQIVFTNDVNNYETDDDDNDVRDYYKVDTKYSSLTHFYSNLKTAVQKYDVVLILAFAESEGKTGPRTISEVYKSSSRQCETQFNKDCGNIWYAMRDASGNAVIFMIQDNHKWSGTNRKYITTNGWYDRTDFASLTNDGSGGVIDYTSSSLYNPIGVVAYRDADDNNYYVGDWVNIDTTGNEPFYNYYKVESYSGSYSAYTYNTIAYPESYTWYINYSVDYQAAIELSINNTSITASEESLDSLPHNLSYYWLYDSTEHDTAFTATVTDSIDVSDVLSQFTDNDTSLLYIEETDSVVKTSSEIGKTKICNINGDVITYLKRFTGSQTQDATLIEEYPQDKNQSYDIKITYDEGLRYSTVQDLYTGQWNAFRRGKNNSRFITGFYVPRLLEDD